jgi:hypothetical protein
LACSGSFPENILSRGIFVEGQNGESSRFVLADLKKNRPGGGAVVAGRSVTDWVALSSGRTDQNSGSVVGGINRGFVEKKTVVSPSIL